MVYGKGKKVITEYHLNKNQPDRPQFAVYDLSDYLEKNGDKASKPHIHSFYQIIWFKKGRGKHFVDFKDYDVSDNALFFIARNQVHYFDRHIDYKGVLIHFNETFLIRHDDEIDFFLKYNISSSPYQRPSCSIDGSTNDILDEYIRQITRELSGREEFGREDLLRSYLKSFLIQIQRRKNGFEKEQGDQNSLVAWNEKRGKLLQFVSLVDEYYNKGLSVGEYARLLLISPRTLSDITHQLLGKTPLRMLQERIILEAQRLLLHSGLNVNQVGYRLGFDDPSYFVKYFKRHAGISPAEFRKSVS